MRLIRLICLTILAALLPRLALAAVGDVVADCQSIATTATLDAQPGAGVEWVIHNIWFEADVELQRYDGTNLAAVAQFIGPNFQWFTPAVHVTNTNYVRIKNLNGSSKVICYDGVVTK